MKQENEKRENVDNFIYILNINSLREKTEQKFE